MGPTYVDSNQANLALVMQWVVRQPTLTEQLQLRLEEIEEELQSPKISDIREQVRAIKHKRQNQRQICDKEQIQPRQLKIKALREEQSSLLKIEADRKHQIWSQISDLERLISAEQSQQSHLDWETENLIKEIGKDEIALIQERDQIEKQLLYAPEIDKAGFSSRLSIDPIKWRDARTLLPAFGLFSIDHPEVIFYRRWHVQEGRIFNKWVPNTGIQAFGLTQTEGSIYQSESTSEERHPYPYQIARCYDDILELMRKPEYRPEGLPKRNSYGIVKIKAKFSGSIPAETRQNVRKTMESRLFSHVYLLSEVENWSVIKKTYVPPAANIKVDPLVVGWHYAFPDVLFYIDAFDITPLENTVQIIP